MSHLINQIVPLALGAAVSPTILAFSVLVLSGQHGRARMVVFTIMNFLVLIAIGLVGLVIFKHAAGSGLPGQQKAAAAAIDSVLGLILILFGFRNALHHPAAEDAETENANEADSAAHLGRYAALGVVMMLSNFTTLALFLPADKEIAISKLPLGDHLAALALLIVFATATAWVPLLAVSLVPGPAGRALAGVNRFVHTYRRQISVVVCFGFGIYLLTKGLSAAPGSHTGQRG